MFNFRRNYILIAILLNLILFGIFLYFTHPAYNTDPEIYFLYTLSGGYGNPPTALLHYVYGWHPLLGGIIATLFRNFPDFNWYAACLILFHFMSCVALSLSFLKTFRRNLALGAFVIFFLFIESRLLMGFNYSGAALIGVISGTVGLLFQFFRHPNMKWPRRRRAVVFFSFLIVIAGLIRIHYVVMFVAFAIWLAAFILSKRKTMRYSLLLLISGLFILLLFQGQKYYYEKKIPGWQQEEQTRQAYAFIANHSHRAVTAGDSLQSLKQEMIGSFFLFDSSLVNLRTIKDFGREHVNRFNISGDLSAFYWLFMDLRIYLALIAGVGLLFMLDRDWKTLLRMMYMSALPLVVFIIMCLFFKITEVILLATVSPVLIACTICMAEARPRKHARIAGVVIALLCAGWMISRLVKADRQNQLAIAHARNVILELNQHSDILFVDAGRFFDLHLSVWDLPEKYPIRNLIYNELVISNSYRGQLDRYGIDDLMKAIPLNENINLVGEKSSMMESYYWLLHHQRVRAVKVPGFQYIDAYRIVPDIPK